MIAEKLTKIKSGLPGQTKLVAVTKTVSKEKILEAYNAGHKIFGENRVQELLSKYDQLPKDIEWHLIGHLQSNKVKYIAPFVSLIHSVDSIRLLETINKEGEKSGRIIDCLLQVHIAKEETKFGFDESEIDNVMQQIMALQLKNICLRGFMGMATFTNDEVKITGEFHSLAGLLEKMKRKYFEDDGRFKELSMGMSSDYNIALKEGSTIIRLGSIIFGSRN
jgi:PLP dependent protein